jgi:RNA polymerase sigma-70 factor (ECF subfamily)
MLRGEDLRQSALSNEPEQFEHFYLTYQEFVYIIALRTVRSPSEAEDVMQSIFLQLWQDPSSFRGGNLESWLTRLTKNRCIDVMRARARFSRSSEPEYFRVRPPESVEDEVFRAMEAAWLAEALLELPEKQRSIITEAFWHDQSHQCIASSVQLPLGTVKTRIRDGIQRLRRKALNEVDGGDGRASMSMRA